MLILALDTSADVCSVALSDGARELSTLRFRHERQLSERLPEIVRFLLRDRGRTLQEVEAFAVGLGPGSFTGVRVGVTLAKTWTQVLGRPLVGVSSLDALAAGVLAFPIGGIAAVAPTRRTEVIAAYYHSGRVTPVAPPRVTLTTNVEQDARAALSAAVGPLLLVGEHAAEVFAVLSPSDAIVIPLTASPDAAVIARLAVARLERGEQDDSFTLAPLYVTPPPIRGADGKFLPV